MVALSETLLEREIEALGEAVELCVELVVTLVETLLKREMEGLEEAVELCAAMAVALAETLYELCKEDVNNDELERVEVEVREGVGNWEEEIEEVGLAAINPKKKRRKIMKKKQKSWYSPT